jgi:hypothetical protein
LPDPVLDFCILRGRPILFLLKEVRSEF